MRKVNTSFLKDMRVLIVDDSSTALLLIKQQLVALGVNHEQIITVERYQNAIKAIETHQFDVLILDYHLEQHLTGYELAMLLYRNRLISDTTGVLMISGDARQETVLTALSGKVRHFVTKPLSNTSLAEKLSVIHRETQKLAQIGQAIIAGETLSASNLFEMINRSGFNISLEAYLLEHWMSKNKWGLIDAYITISSTQCHASKMCAIAHLLHRDNNTQQAIEELHSFLTENPLSIRVMDTLSLLYAESNQASNAAQWANKAFELTPSIGERASRASHLTAVANKRNQLLKIGQIYAKHMSLADINWLKSVVQHFQSLENVYQLTESTSAKTDVLQHANKFVQLAGRKLTQKRAQQLLALHHLFQCHILIDENNDSLGHKKLMQAMASFYDELFECPPILLMEFLPALELFGEHEIHASLVNVLKARGANMQPLGQSQNPFQINARAPEHYQAKDERLLSQAFVQQFPHSCEAKIQFLHAYSHDSNQSDTNQIRRIVSELATLDLPPNWHNWITTGKQHGFTVAPPAAFSLSTLNNRM
ncbi:hypothetical protein VII00023_07919 [Vibrio ichthyoenteri ATCC 700023]|uniref:Response regulatory domain-containing protein n=1 Tax=Vibrio ichthyoenteri ATCC 700023 TaxID=870968 RepID=F9S779_9VIBR|nr:response regulator [Vibrio ichthyoenteri]EGU31966.1 hypothetical protein VII00023_07919 [Vibrio ichthyoenteri ATCC 700023]